MPKVREEAVPGHGQVPDWEAAFTEGVAVPFEATLLGISVEVQRFRVNRTNTVQCQVVREHKQRWVGMEDLDEESLPEECRRLLGLYRARDGQAPPDVRASRRRAYLERIADHVLRVGLRGASLRPLAAAAGTSNRMLLYYFTDKDELLKATLGHLAERLLRLLASSGASAEPVPFHVLLPGILEAMRSPAIAPYMQLWLELAAMAAREEEPFRAIAARICDDFLAWAAARLQVEREADRALLAALLLGTVDGLVLLDAVGRRSAVDAALAGASLVHPR